MGIKFQYLLILYLWVAKTKSSYQSNTLMSEITWQAIDDTVQSHGEGGSFPVKFKECSVPTYTCWRSRVLILLICPETGTLYLSNTPSAHLHLLALVSIWGWWLRMDGFQAWLKLKEEAVCSAYSKVTESNTWGLFAFLWKTEHPGEEQGRIVHPVQLLQGYSCWCICDWII